MSRIPSCINATEEAASFFRDLWNFWGDDFAQIEARMFAEGFSREAISAGFDRELLTEGV